MTEWNETRDVAGIGYCVTILEQMIIWSFVFCLFESHSQQCSETAPVLLRRAPFTELENEYGPLGANHFALVC